MDELARSVRRATLAIVVLAIGQLLHDGIDPYGGFSAASRGLQIALAIVLLAGIIPGSYLTPVFRRTGKRIVSVSPRRAIFVALGAPLALLALAAYFAIGELALLLQIGDQATRISLWFDLVMGLIQLTILALNIVDVRRSSSRRSGA